MTRLIIAAVALFATTAQAQAPHCLPHAVMVDTLKHKYGEEQRMIAFNPSAITELYENDETGTWTLLVTGLNRMACIRGSGKDGVQIMNAVEPAEGT